MTPVEKLRVYGYELNDCALPLLESSQKGPLVYRLVVAGLWLSLAKWQQCGVRRQQRDGREAVAKIESVERAG